MCPLLAALHNEFGWYDRVDGARLLHHGAIALAGCFSKAPQRARLRSRANLFALRCGIAQLAPHDPSG